MSFVDENIIILLIGFISIIALLIKSLCMKLNQSPVPIYILLGLMLRIIFDYSSDSSEKIGKFIQFFGDIGLIFILFQVGIESKFKGLIEQLKKAVFISFFEVFFSGIFVFICGYYFIKLAFPTALLISAAFTATSIAISISVWQETKRIKTPLGNLLVDLSALDDIAGITLLAIFVPIASSLSVSVEYPAASYIFYLAMWSILKLGLFMIVCYVFAELFEFKFSKFFKNFEVVPDPVVSIFCIALIFSGISGLFGLSLALGAFFTGLAFSRDASTVRMLSSYQSLESFFMPFFYLSVGFSVTSLSSISPWIVGMLIIAVFTGKFIGVAAPALLSRISFSASIILGLSMIPRAEITLVILQYIKQMTFPVISPEFYSTCVLVVLISCLIPICLKPILISHFATHKARSNH